MQTDAEDPIDPAILEQLTSLGDSSFMAELAKLYLDDLGPRVDAIARAIAGSDAAAAATAAHTLKGSSANLGLTKLAAAAARLEHHHRGEDQGSVAEMMDDLLGCAQVARRRLEPMAAQT